jgi:hypothetical protein
MFTTSRTPIRRLATHGAAALIATVAIAASTQAAMAGAQASVTRTAQVAHVHSLTNRNKPVHALTNRNKPVHSLTNRNKPVHSLTNRPKPSDSIANAPKFCHGSPC